jgi:hypothetical protein
MPGGDDPVSTTQEETSTPASVTSMRVAAEWFLDQRTLPRHESMKLYSRDFSGFIEQLIPDVEELAASHPESDVPSRVALAAVDEARRRLHEPEAPGLLGEMERVKRLARSVVALCDHSVILTGMRMCLTCDKPIEDGETFVPYDTVSLSGGALQSGRIHASCAAAVSQG